jgi:hypothetical protein
MRRIIWSYLMLTAWVLWEHAQGDIDGRREDFWLLRQPFETRAECLKLADFEVDLKVGEGPPDSLLTMMEKAAKDATGITYRRIGAGYREDKPNGRGYLEHWLECWPAGTDPRPHGKE